MGDSSLALGLLEGLSLGHHDAHGHAEVLHRDAILAGGDLVGGGVENFWLVLASVIVLALGELGLPVGLPDGLVLLAVESSVTVGVSGGELGGEVSHLLTLELLVGLHLLELFDALLLLGLGGVLFPVGVNFGLNGLELGLHSGVAHFICLR